jgi:hypothetical protein
MLAVLLSAFVLSRTISPTVFLYSAARSGLLQSISVPSTVCSHSTGGLTMSRSYRFRIASIISLVMYLVVVSAVPAAAQGRPVREPPADQAARAKHLSRSNSTGSRAGCCWPGDGSASGAECPRGSCRPFPSRVPRRVRPTCTGRKIHNIDIT